MKRWILSLIICSFPALILLGCSDGSATISENDEQTFAETVSFDSPENTSGVTLTLYGHGDDLSKTYLQKIIAMYEAETGNRIDCQGFESSNSEAISLAKFESGDIPDLYIHFGNSYLYKFNPEENFVDWSDAQWVLALEDSILPQVTYNNMIVGLPFWESSHSGCFYNKRIFADLELDIPRTQTEFNEVCDKLLENGIQPIYLAASDGWPVFYQFALDPVLEEHPEYIEGLNTGEMTYADIPEFISMCEWFKMAADKGYFGEIYSTDTWDYSSEILGTGEAAMMFVWDTWFDTDYNEEDYLYQVEDFGIMPVFMGTCEEGTYEEGNVNLIMANKNGENVEIAVEFINFMAEPENYNIAFEGISTDSVFKGQTTNVKSVQYEENKENVDALIRASLAQPKIIGFNQVLGGKALLRLMLGEISVEECVEIIDNDRIASLKEFLEE
ncbi:MAG: ABC transporter substrate-binding protein [Lachnospiraceae bacterium]